jgi:hypothetical protein
MLELSRLVQEQAWSPEAPASSLRRRASPSKVSEQQEQERTDLLAAARACLS